MSINGCDCNIKSHQFNELKDDNEESNLSTCGNSSHEDTLLSHDFIRQFNPNPPFLEALESSVSQKAEYQISSEPQDMPLEFVDLLLNTEQGTSCFREVSVIDDLVHNIMNGNTHAVTNYRIREESSSNLIDSQLLADYQNPFTSDTLSAQMSEEESLNEKLKNFLHENFQQEKLSSSEMPAVNPSRRKTKRKKIDGNSEIQSSNVTKTTMDTIQILFENFCFLTGHEDTQHYFKKIIDKKFKNEIYVDTKHFEILKNNQFKTRNLYELRRLQPTLYATNHTKNSITIHQIESLIKTLNKNADHTKIVNFFDEILFPIYRLKKSDTIEIEGLDSNILLLLRYLFENQTNKHLLFEARNDCSCFRLRNVYYALLPPSEKLNIALPREDLLLSLPPDLMNRFTQSFVQKPN